MANINKKSVLSQHVKNKHQLPEELQLPMLRFMLKGTDPGEAIKEYLALDCQDDFMFDYDDDVMGEIKDYVYCTMPTSIYESWTKVRAHLSKEN